MVNEDRLVPEESKWEIEAYLREFPETMIWSRTQLLKASSRKVYPPGSKVRFVSQDELFGVVEKEIDPLTPEWDRIVENVELHEGKGDPLGSYYDGGPPYYVVRYLGLPKNYPIKRSIASWLELSPTGG